LLGLALAAAGSLVIAIAVCGIELWPIVVAEVLVGFGLGLSESELHLLHWCAELQPGAVAVLGSCLHVGGSSARLRFGRHQGETIPMHVHSSAPGLGSRGSIDTAHIAHGPASGGRRLALLAAAVLGLLAVAYLAVCGYMAFTLTKPERKPFQVFPEQFGLT